jgi:uncharacterized protein
MFENQPDTKLPTKKSVLITGGSGMIGRHLTKALTSRGYKVTHLSRNPRQSGNENIFTWDPENNLIDPAWFKGIDHIVHLAGTNLGEKRWSKKRKEAIVESRVGSAKLLYRMVSDNKIPLRSFISASATGYYGTITSENIYKEDDPPADDFLGSTCRQWEEAADLFANAGIRTVKIRTSVVLEKSDSALTKLMKPARFGFLVQTGNGKQYMPWIHINDLCNIYIKAIEDSSISGAYNAVSPDHVTHRMFIENLSKVLKRPVFPVPVPAFMLKSILGEMSVVILQGSRISSEKIVSAGYNFIFKNLKEALDDVINGQD